MRPKLSSTDCKAIDLVLDSGASPDGWSDRTFVSHSDVALSQHIEAVERVFDLLGILPVAEPSVDLACRTLAHVREVAGTAVESNPLNDALAAHQRH